MGIYGIGPGSLLIILLIVILLFGTKRLKSLGQDLASFMKSFRKGLQEEEQTQHKNKDDTL